jgi:hypothetical protein
MRFTRCPDDRRSATQIIDCDQDEAAEKAEMLEERILGRVSVGKRHIQKRLATKGVNIYLDD